MCLLQLNYGDATNIVLFQKYNNNKKNKEKTENKSLIGSWAPSVACLKFNPPNPPSPLLLLKKNIFVSSCFYYYYCFLLLIRISAIWGLLKYLKKKRSAPHFLLFFPSFLLKLTLKRK
jgi:hypothetical protein